MSKFIAPYAIAVIVGETKTGYVVDENNKPSLFYSHKAGLEMVDRLNSKSDARARFCILRPGDVREGQSVDSCYSNGIAVYK